MFFFFFTILVSFKFKYINSFILWLSETRKSGLEEEGATKTTTKKAVFPTTSFDVAGSRASSTDINVSFSHSRAEDASRTFAHLRQWESTSIFAPLFRSWADLVDLHFKTLWILFLVPHGSQRGADAEQGKSNECLKVPSRTLSACITQFNTTDTVLIDQLWFIFVGVKVSLLLSCYFALLQQSPTRLVLHAG